jgi:hypothetical protein
VWFFGSDTIFKYNLPQHLNLERVEFAIQCARTSAFAKRAFASLSRDAIQRPVSFVASVLSTRLLKSVFSLCVFHFSTSPNSSKFVVDVMTTENFPNSYFLVPYNQ